MKISKIIRPFVKGAELISSIINCINKDSIGKCHLMSLLNLDMSLFDNKKYSHIFAVFKEGNLRYRYLINLK